MSWSTCSSSGDCPTVELLRSTSVTRQTAGALGNLLRCLADPTSARKLAVAFQVWRRDDRDDPDAQALVEAVSQADPRLPGGRGLSLAPGRPRLAGAAGAPSCRARSWTCWSVSGRWPAAGTAPPSLPIDQLILTLADDLFQEPAELALAHKLAVLLRDVSAAHPGYRLTELVEELAVIARNERRFLGFSGEDTGFEPPARQRSPWRPCTRPRAWSGTAST